MYVVFYLLSWILPVVLIVLIVLLFRSLGVIIEELRSLNTSSLRIAAAVEKLGAAEDRLDRRA